ncbi:MAG: hypothetical protein ABI925_12140 [Verrucomicrobiota bacterium]
MDRLIRTSTIAFAASVLLSATDWAQSPPLRADDAVRVMVTMNTDGSRTVYKFDDAQHKAMATTSNADGKLREKIRYDLDEAGRFSTGQVTGPDGKLRFKSRYKYDNSGRMQEEIQMSETDAVLHKIVYSYDQNGKQAGYSIFDGLGKLLSRTAAPAAAASPKPRQKK